MVGLTKLEKITYLGCPWFFGVVLVVCGIFVTGANATGLQGILLICTGLLCMSLYCVCALLAKIIAAK